MLSSVNFVLSLLALSASVSAHPGHGHSHSHHSRRAVERSLKTLVDGNQRFIQKVASSSDPNVLKDLATEGQAPPFMFLGCADSRVNDGTIFDAAPGTFFTERNIANQYFKTDINAQATLAYGITVLGVEHVIVMGHYGCGGVAASIASPPDGGVDAAGASVQSWIQPIRDLYESSTREEIVTLRNANANATEAIPEPENADPGFRALVEENVKATVKSIASDAIIVNLYKALAATPANDTAAVPEVRKRNEELAPLKNVFIHGLVYDIETGSITDLGVSVGPPGVEIPTLGGAPAVVAEQAITPPKTASPDIIHTFIPPAAKRNSKARLDSMRR